MKSVTIILEFAAEFSHTFHGCCQDCLLSSCSIRHISIGWRAPRLRRWRSTRPSLIECSHQLPNDAFRKAQPSAEGEFQNPQVREYHGSVVVT